MTRAAAHDLPVRFGRYELVDHIATGGMAEVFLARSFGPRGFQKHVVVKRLRPGLAHAPHIVRLFVQEARISAGLVHPNVVQIHELGAVPAGGEGIEHHYIAMEYIHGQDLARTRRALAAAGRTMPVGLAVYCAVRVLRALAYAHARSDGAGRPLGLVHRDVSPHNVLVSFQGQVKLVDFGIARIEGEATGGALPGGGKYAYMSPEQAAGQPVDARSDVYSTGILLWELLVGHRLFQHPDAQEKLRQVREGRIPDPREENPAVPAPLWALLQRLLARDPAARPTAAEAEEALQALAYEQGLRGDARSLGALLRELFPEEARRDPGGLDLDGLVADLARLGVPGGALHPEVPGDDELTASETGHTHDFSMERRTPASGLRGLSSPERKAVVVLAAEVIGFEALSEAAEPEAIGRAHYRLLRRVRRIVDRHGGWLDRFQDDTLVVFFGVPRASEHDLDRALACAAQLVREVRRTRLPGERLQLAVGVHQGEISYGRHEARPAARRLRYLARGDTTGLAHRLCRAAGPDEVWVSERVAVQVGDRFRFGPAPAVPRRDGGRDACAVLLGRETGVRASAGRWLPRGDELERVGQALRGVAAGRRVVLAVEGPAGVGKSRLVQELRDLAGARGLPVYGARAVPYTVDRPLATLRDLLARILGVPVDAGAEAVAAGLARLAELGLDGREVQAVGAFLGIEGVGLEAHEDLLRAAGRVVVGLAGQGPALLVLEDVQHLSGVEREIVRFVLDQGDEVRLLLLLSGRDDAASALAPESLRVALEPLSAEVEAALVADQLGAREVEPALLDLVRRRAEGNPRYVAAVLDALQAARAVAVRDGRAELCGDRRGALPEGLEALVAARIDALEPACRDALQVAAVLGPGFPAEVLAGALGAADLVPVLDTLRAQHLLAEQDGRWDFPSELVREVAGRSLLAARRRELHARVARAMEAHLGTEGPHLGELALHLAEAGRLLDAARLGDRVGDQLRAQQLLRPAARQWTQALDWLALAQRGGAPTSVCLRGEASLHCKLGDARLLLGEPEQAERHLQAAMDAAAECEERRVEASALLHLGRLVAGRGGRDRATLYLESARDLARGEGELAPWQREIVVQASEALGGLLHEAGLHDRAEAAFAVALDHAGQDDALAAQALLGLARRHIRAGDEARALQVLGEARARARAAGDRILLGRVVNNTGLVHHGAGRYRQALELFEEARALRRDTGYRQGEAVNLHNIGDAWLRLDEPGRAWAAFERSRDLALAIGWTRGVALNELWMAWLEARRGGGQALLRLETAAERAAATGDAETAVSGRWLLGRAHLQHGAVESARALLQRALADARALGALPLARDIQADLERLEAPPAPGG